MSDQPKRINLSKKIRFEVFKRDSFTCQYCGRKAPDTTLQCDHIEPVSKGGTNDILNLITSCHECNIGKSNRRLSDNTVVEKQHQQLAALQERKEQMEMMFKWQADLLNIEESYINGLASFWENLVPGWSVSDAGREELRKLYCKFTAGEIMEGMKVAVQYVEYGTNGVADKSWDAAWGKIGGICHVRKASKNDPSLKRLYYIRGILRNRLRYVNEDKALCLLKAAVALNATIESLEEHAKVARNWTEWRTQIEAFIQNPGGGEDA